MVIYLDNKPLVVHRNKTIYLIEKFDKNYKVEDELNKYATLVHTPSNVHTYCLDNFSLWSAALLEIREDEIIRSLQQNSKNILPKEVIKYIKDTMKDFWTIELFMEKDCFKIVGKGKVISKIVKDKDIEKKLIKQKATSLTFHKKDLYIIRKRLLRYNVYLKENNDKSTSCNLRIKDNITLYKYQNEAVECFIDNKRTTYGRGVIIMPPGSGKTIVALRIIETLKVNTLILIKAKETYKQWVAEMTDKTNFNEEHIAYNDLNSNKPISICTYGYVSKKVGEEDIEISRGFVIYDDAHNLPVKQSSVLAYISSKYKLAMDSILWRSDHNDTYLGDIFQ